MDIEKLKKINEWAAVGYYESVQNKDPWPIPFGKAYRSMYEHMEVIIHDKGFIWPIYKTGIICPTSNAGLMIERYQFRDVNFHKSVIQNTLNKYPDYKWLNEEFIEDLMVDFSPETNHFGGWTHSNPDIRRVVKEGFLSMVKELDEELETCSDESERNLLLAVKEYTEGVKVFHQKSVLAMENAAMQAKGKLKDKLNENAAAFKHGFMHPGRTFKEGLFAVFFTLFLDFRDSIGRVDQVLGDLFENDISSGKLDIEEARELLDTWLLNVVNWNMQIGGITPDGKEGIINLPGKFFYSQKRLHDPTLI